MSGPVAGTITRAYNNDFMVKTLSVNGSATDITYDDDGMITSVGAIMAID
jgi:hypothetical protein